MLAHYSNSPRVDMSPTRTHYPDSEPPSLLLLLNAAYLLKQQKQIESLWFEATEVRAHDLSHFRPYALINCRQNMSDHCKLKTICYTSEQLSDKQQAYIKML